jgi:hypothetical protein
MEKKIRPQSDNNTPVVPYILPLRNVASLKYDFLGAVYNAAQGDPSTFNSTFLEILIDFKWKIYVKKVFYVDWLLYFILIISFCVHSLWFVKYPRSTNRTERGFGITLYVIVWMLHAYFVRHEYKQAVYGFEKFQPLTLIKEHFKDPWNLPDFIRISLITCSLTQYGIMLAKSSSSREINPDDLRWVSMISSITIPMFALGFLFYLQAASGYGALVRMVFKIIESTKSFVAILLILILGYTTSFTLLAKTDFSTEFAGDLSWNSYGRAFLSSSLLVMGVDVNIENIIDSYYAPIAVALLYSFLFLIGVILLNLLIAIMSDKHDSVKSQERASSIYNRAGIIVEYEKLMSEKDRNKPSLNPQYLQVLRAGKCHYGW